MKKLVSVIIPCFNAERWLPEALDSCLQQTYAPLEIIVVDDGSTDRCVEILKSYGDRIIWETGPNRGGNHARNRGLALSKGDYIQYLDADDYILPEKIALQVQALEATQADVVYSDWRYQHHRNDGSSYLDEIKVAGPESDLLAAILADRWVPPVAIMFSRQAAIASGGWDETLKAAQDRDFLLSVLINGSKAVYQPGCHSIYRRYGNTTVSTANKNLWLRSHWRVMEKAEQRLREQGQLSDTYRQALATSYFLKARYYFPYLHQKQHLQILQKIQSLDPHFQVDNSTLKTSKLYDLIQSSLGFISAEISLRLKWRLGTQIAEHSQVGLKMRSLVSNFAQNLSFLRFPLHFPKNQQLNEQLDKREKLLTAFNSLANEENRNSKLDLQKTLKS